ncbi:hypothetical protein HPB52_005512 [Rhipicephalus sanguineus]|uniref:Uncharacterized protein n=1 Tax=Rhipicephalus sanguineus TaxID=34632 RepID=A0A9D4STD3_RHISA|nr:hypothetical protein HPB52_005512 [Rhipicephalus sanguineus]
MGKTREALGSLWDTPTNDKDHMDNKDDAKDAAAMVESECSTCASQRIVEKSFKKTRLSNTLDGTEGKALWEGSDSGRDDDSQSDFSTSDSD